MKWDVLLRAINKTSILGTFVLMVGCGDSPTFSLLPDGQEFDLGNGGIFTNKLDIVFVIDNSPSMSNNQKKLGESFKSFISNFKNKGWDYRIAVTTSDAFKIQFQADRPAWTDEEYAMFKDGNGATHSGIRVITPSTPDVESVFLINVQVGAGGAGDERAFSSLYAALQSPTNAGFLRPDSFLAVIVLSDEDDFSDLFEGNTMDITTTPRKVGSGDHNYDDERLDPVDSYVNYLDTLTNSSGTGRRYNVSAIVKPDLKTCKDAFGGVYGKRYVELAEKTNGIISPICDPSFDKAVEDIQGRISVLSTQVVLDRTPVVESITVTMDGVVIPMSQTDGWWYYPEGNVIRFSGSAIPASQVRVRITFTPTAPKM